MEAPGPRSPGAGAAGAGAAGAGADGAGAAHVSLRSCYKRAALAMHPDRNQAAVVGAEAAAVAEEQWKIITNRMDRYLKVLEKKAEDLRA